MSVDIEEAVELAKSVTTQTLHGPIPTETTVKIAIALLVLDGKTKPLTREQRVRELIQGALEDESTLDAKNLCIWMQGYILNNDAKFPYPHMSLEYLKSVLLKMQEEGLITDVDFEDSQTSVKMVKKS